MKRILIFSLAYYPSNVSGAEVAIKEITDRISPSDIEFHLITLLFDTHAARKERIGNVEVYRVGFGGAYLSKMLYIPLAALKARSLNRALHFDALWSMMTYMLMPVTLSHWLGVRAPHILTLQDGDPYEKVFGRAFIKPFLPLIDAGFRQASVVQAISNYLATWPKKRGYRGEVIVIPNGASMPSAQDYPAEELEALTSEVGKQPGDFFMVSVSRLVHQKAIDMVIRALALLPQKVKYLVVGEGPDRPMLEKLASELGVEDRVTFTGQVDRTMTAKYRKISDVFVLPSRSEGQGISFLSTMVARLPMIATQEGGIADFLFDAKRNPDKTTTGWAVDVDSPEQIAAAVQEVMANPARAKEVAGDAYAVASELYDWDRIAPRMEHEVFSRAWEK